MVAATVLVPGLPTIMLIAMRRSHISKTEPTRFRIEFIRTVTIPQRPIRLMALMVCTVFSASLFLVIRELVCTPVARMLAMLRGLSMQQWGASERLMKQSQQL